MGREFDISAWNDAQQYIKEIIHPLLKDHLEYSQTCYYGATNLDEAKKMSPKQREIERFNGLKGQVTTTLLICEEIYSTVSLKKKKEEIEMLEKISEKLQKVLSYIEDNPDDFFIEDEDGRKLDQKKIRTFRNYDVGCYKNLTKIMTKNNLLFKGDFEEVSQEDIIAQLEEEVMEA